MKEQSHEGTIKQNILSGKQKFVHEIRIFKDAGDADVCGKLQAQIEDM